MALPTTPDDAATHDVPGQALVRPGDQAAALPPFERAAQQCRSAPRSPPVVPAAGLPQIERARR